MQPGSTFLQPIANDELYLIVHPFIVADLWRGEIPIDATTPKHY